ncbi:MAG: hypothetical protein N3I86_05750 [Verrucomicrobiae bacterium]|nr:hypothetical protein [Verrucomicrobiae bacterium]
MLAPSALTAVDRTMFLATRLKTARETRALPVAIRCSMFDVGCSMFTAWRSLTLTLSLSLEGEGIPQAAQDGAGAFEMRRLAAGSALSRFDG